MDIRCPPNIGVVNDLVHELHNNAVRFRHPLRFFTVRLFIFFHFQFSQEIGDGRTFVRRLVKVIDKLDDIFCCGHFIDNGLRFHDTLNGIPFDDVIGIIDKDMDLVFKLS